MRNFFISEILVLLRFDEIHTSVINIMVLRSILYVSFCSFFVYYFSLCRNTKDILSDIAPLLGGVEYDQNGRVKRASATILYWLLKKSNPHSPEWEVEFIEKVLHSNRTLPPGMELYAITLRSYQDMLHEVVNSNMTVLFCGMSLITLYVIVMIGRCNAMRQRIYLSLMGIFVVGQAILSSYGLCYYMGFSYGPVHPILPFLLLGIGVDDMFIIMQSLETTSETEKSLDVSTRIAKSIQVSGAIKF